MFNGLSVTSQSAIGVGKQRFPFAQRIQACCRPVSSWVGDDQRIQTVDCSKSFWLRRVSRYCIQSSCFEAPRPLCAEDRRYCRTGTRPCRKMYAEKPNFTADKERALHCPTKFWQYAAYHFCTLLDIIRLKTRRADSKVRGMRSLPSSAFASGKHNDISPTSHR